MRVKLTGAELQSKTSILNPFPLSLVDPETRPRSASPTPPLAVLCIHRRSELTVWSDPTWRTCMWNSQKRVQPRHLTASRSPHFYLFWVDGCTHYTEVLGIQQFIFSWTKHNPSCTQDAKPIKQGYFFTLSCKALLGSRDLEPLGWERPLTLLTCLL